MQQRSYDEHCWMACRRLNRYRSLGWSELASGTIWHSHCRCSMAALWITHLCLRHGDVLLRRVLLVHQRTGRLYLAAKSSARQASVQIHILPSHATLRYGGTTRKQVHLSHTYQSQRPFTKGGGCYATLCYGAPAVLTPPKRGLHIRPRFLVLLEAAQ
jgi:hypothetical protein